LSPAVNTVTESFGFCAMKSSMTFAVSSSRMFHGSLPQAAMSPAPMKIQRRAGVGAAMFTPNWSEPAPPSRSVTVTVAVYEPAAA
jgi:hypothetical protein